MPQVFHRVPRMDESVHPPAGTESFSGCACSDLPPATPMQPRLLPCTPKPPPGSPSPPPRRKKTPDLPFITGDPQGGRERLPECVHELVPLSLGHDLEFLIVVLEELVLLDDLGIPTFPVLTGKPRVSEPPTPGNPAHEQACTPEPLLSPGPTDCPRLLPPSVASSAPSGCDCSRRALARRPMAHAAAHAERTQRPSTASTHAALPAAPRGPRGRVLAGAV